MSNQKVLEKAIQKAIEGGFEFGINRLNWLRIGEGKVIGVNWNEIKDHLFDVIYDHDFAKALWGELPYHFVSYKTEAKDDFITQPPIQLTNAQYHTQLMVISNDPIKYLKENI